MKLTHLHLCGFRGYRREVRFQFAKGFNIIDGRNGVGKSTIFDAVESVLTGELSKYSGATASGQSAADYIWWMGDAEGPTDSFVEVGFTGEEGDWVIRRTPLDPKTFSLNGKMLAAFAHPGLAPENPLKQLCATTIIRDEHIANLSLELKETERYALLRQAIGATDAEKWIGRAHGLLGQTKRRREAAQAEVTSLANDVVSASKRVDELRLALASGQTINEATERLKAFLNVSAATPEALIGLARQRIANAESLSEGLATLRDSFESYQAARQTVARLTGELPAAQMALEEARARVRELGPPELIEKSSALADRARSLIELIHTGRTLGLVDDHCPLCATRHSEESFAAGTHEAELLASQIDAFAAGLALREAQFMAAQADASAKHDAERSLAKAIEEAQEAADGWNSRAMLFTFSSEPNLQVISARTQELSRNINEARYDLRILETLRFNDELARTLQAETAAKDRLQKGQERFGRTRKAEAVATAVHDAARRAAAETLDLRIERVLPLMAELYYRLKPHPVWQDIDYAIRGDVRRFLSLRVGENLNPQFLFSSGQRRATGLAFLLSINLSLAWSRWQSILLDDPMQHVDDFRSVHLAEVLAQLVYSGKQVICAVEDSALADMMCRRLPIEGPSAAKRMTLAIQSDGSLAVQSARFLSPLPSRVLSDRPQALAS